MKKGSSRGAVARELCEPRVCCDLGVRRKAVQNRGALEGSPVRQICIVTHAEATHHMEGLVDGWYNSPLAEKGRLDARACGVRLPELGWASAPIVSSDLSRAKQTAREIAACLGSKVEYDSRLREMSFGRAEDQPIAVTGPILFSCGAERLDFRNAFGGETKREFTMRLCEAMSEIVTGDKAILCTHGHAAASLMACWVPMPLESVVYVNFHVPSGSMTLLAENDLSRDRIVEILGDTSHPNG